MRQADDPTIKLLKIEEKLIATSLTPLKQKTHSNKPVEPYIK